MQQVLSGPLPKLVEQPPRPYGVTPPPTEASSSQYRHPYDRSVRVNCVHVHYSTLHARKHSKTFSLQYNYRILAIRGRSQIVTSLCLNTRGSRTPIQYLLITVCVYFIHTDHTMALQCHMTEAIRRHPLVTIALRTALEGPIHRHALLMELHPLEDHHGHRMDHQWDHAHPDLVTLLSRCQDFRRDREHPHSSCRV